MKLPFDIMWVAEQCGLLNEKTVAHGVEINVRCPLPGCNDKKQHLAINIAKNVWNCPHCGTGGSMVDMYALMGKSYPIDRKQAFKELMTLWENENPNFDLENRKIRDEQRKKRLEEIRSKSPDENQAPIEVRDHAYRKLLEYLHYRNNGLKQEHLEDLLRRGLTPEDIRKFNIESMCLKGERIVVPDSWNTAHVSGFYTYGKHRYINTCVEGFIIPYKDPWGRIGMLEIRQFGDATPRYLRFTSGTPGNGRTECTKSSTMVHYVGIDPSNPPSKVYLTEGGLKANVAHALTGRPFIAIPGVNNRCRLGEALDQLKSFNVKEIVLAFDMDLYKNENVEKAMKKAMSMVKERGFILSAATWDTNIKGIDDLWLLIKQKREGKYR